MVTIRPAEQADLDRITEIYNEAVRTTTATFDTELRSAQEQRAWFDAHGERHPVLVADYEGTIAGWTALSRWHDRAGYRDTAETSFYVAEAYRGKGIGRALKSAIIEEARRLGYHTLIALVAEGSEASLHLNESFGFRRVGILREVGAKFGRRLDVHIMQKLLG